MWGGEGGAAGRVVLLAVRGGGEEGAGRVTLGLSELVSHLVLLHVALHSHSERLTHLNGSCLPSS